VAKVQACEKDTFEAGGALHFRRMKHVSSRVERAKKQHVRGGDADCASLSNNERNGEEEPQRKGQFWYFSSNVSHLVL
jgi:hypothetical protein